MFRKTGVCAGFTLDRHLVGIKCSHTDKHQIHVSLHNEQMQSRKFAMETSYLVMNSAIAGYKCTTIILKIPL